jgi:predicted HD superfamily hydrolase involved in NAD metabolism
MIQRFFADIPQTSNIPTDVTAVLHHHGYSRIAGHVARVAAEARRLAVMFGGDETAAAIAGWLHDVGAIIPNDQRVAICHAFDVNVLPEETAVPFILHGKLSAVIAAEIWSVDDQTILNAIACHTTLKANASLLDKILFVADKIAWDQPGRPPYLAGLVSALEISLDDAAACYLDYLWQQRIHLKMIHPDLVAAYEQFH